MKKKDIVVGEVYLAKVSNRIVEVRVDSLQEGMRYRSGKKPVDVLTYLVTNLVTGKRLQFRSAMRFRSKAHVGPKPIPATVQQAVKDTAPELNKALGYFGDGKDDVPATECNHPKAGGNEVYVCDSMTCSVHGERNCTLAK